jgi:hypothetical protein
VGLVVLVIDPSIGSFSFVEDKGAVPLLVGFLKIAAVQCHIPDSTPAAELFQITESTRLDRHVEAP